MVLQAIRAWRHSYEEHLAYMVEAFQQTTADPVSHDDCSRERGSVLEGVIWHQLERQDWTAGDGQLLADKK